MSQPHVIAFVGPVGSGKSTQMKLLASRLRAQGVKVKISFLKTGHIFAYFLEVVLAGMLVRGKKEVFPIRALIEEKSHIFKKLFKLWLILDTISVFFKFLLNIYIPVIMGHIVLVEEYIVASIADYIYLTKALGLSHKTTFSILHIVLRLLPLGGPMQVIFLDAETDELKFRWSSRHSLYEVLDYIYMQRTLLFSLSKKLSSYKVIYIDTTRLTIKETHKLIVDYLSRSLPKIACSGNDD